MRTLEPAGVTTEGEAPAPVKRANGGATLIEAQPSPSVKPAGGYRLVAACARDEMESPAPAPQRRRGPGEPGDEPA